MYRVTINDTKLLLRFTEPQNTFPMFSRKLMLVHSKQIKEMGWVWILNWVSQEILGITCQIFRLGDKIKHL